MQRTLPQKRWNGKNVNLWVCCLFLGLAFSKSCDDPVLAANAKAIAFPGTLTLQEGKLTARIAAIPLRQVILELGRLSDAQVLWMGPPDENPVSVDFTGLSVAEALQRLLPQKNFLLVYASTAPDARLTRIWISSTKEKVEAPPLIPRAVQSPPEQLTPSVVEPDQEDEDSGAAPEENLDDSRAQARMIDAALEQVTTAQNPTMRAETIEMLEGYARQDPRVRAALTQLAYDNGDPFVQRTAAEALERLP